MNYSNWLALCLLTRPWNLQKFKSRLQYTAKDVELKVASRGDTVSQYIPHVEAAAKFVQAQFDYAGGKNTNVAFGYSNGVALGAYVSSAIENIKENGIFASFLEKLSKGELRTSGSTMQVCDEVI